MSRRIKAGVVAVLIVFLTALPGVAAAGGESSRPGAFYLSLGDSQAFGAQFDRLFEMLDAGTYTPDAFDTGWTDVFAAQMRTLRPGLRVANLSCPGETTDTMIHGGCFFTAPEPDGFGLAIHTTYDGPQLAAALAFLRAHRGQVSPVTLSIGGADAAGAIADVCDFDAACVEASGFRRQLAASLGRILLALRVAAPRSEIIVVPVYDIFLHDRPDSAALWRSAFTDVERRVARVFGARVADASQVIGNEALLCALTFACTTGDSHPTDEGYRRIGNLIFDVFR